VLSGGATAEDAAAASAPGPVAVAETLGELVSGAPGPA